MPLLLTSLVRFVCFSPKHAKFDIVIKSAVLPNEMYSQIFLSPQMTSFFLLNLCKIKFSSVFLLFKVKIALTFF